MSVNVREQFQGEIDEFIDDLQVFATGSYLKEEDKVLWDPPFDRDALPELKQLMEIFLDTAQLLELPVSEEAAETLVKRFYENLDNFNERYEYAVLEPEEKSDIEGFVHKVLTFLGADSDDLERLIEFE